MKTLFAQKLIAASLLFLLAAGLFSIFLIAAPDYLTGDEVFYYFQAQHIRQGEFVWFSQTQPLLYPLILSVFSFESVLVLRVVSVVLMALAAAILFYLAATFFNRWTAALAFGLFVVHPAIIRYSILLFNEALTLVFLLLSLYVFLLIIQNPQIRWSQFIIWGGLLGLLVQTKIAAVVFLPIFYFYLLYQWRRENKAIPWPQLIASLAIIGVMAVPYLWLGGWNFVVTKASLVGPPSRTLQFRTVLQFLNPFLLFALILVFLFGLRKRIEYFLFGLIAFYTFVLYFSNRAVFERHFVIIIPLLILLLSLKLLWPIRPRIGQTVLAVLLMFYLAWLPFSLQAFSVIDSNNYFFERPDCKIIESVETSCAAGEVSLPFFIEAAPLTCTYSAEIQLDQTYRQVIINYPDDGLLARVDNYSFTHRDPYSPAEFNVVLEPGQHFIYITATNTSNIGGLGQILVCR